MTKKILLVTANPRKESSRTHALSQKFLQNLKLSTDCEVTHRDLVVDTPPHFDPLILKALFTPEKERPSDVASAFKSAKTLTEELFATDYIVFSMPMYNFNIPSIFKAYIDNIVLPGVTVKYHEDGKIEGLIQGKKCLIISTRGAAYADGWLKDLNHFEPYLNSILGYIGLTDIKYIIAEGVDFLAPEDQEKSLRNAEKNLSKIITTWTNI